MNQLLKVEVKSMPDELSTFGEYTDEPSDWAIVCDRAEYLAVLRADNADYELPAKGSQFRFFIPPDNGEVEGSADYQKYGHEDYSRAVALNNGSWSYIGIVAEAKIKTEAGSDIIQRISSGGCWGCESDAGREHLVDSIAKEELDALLSELVALNVDVSQFEQLSKAAIDAAQF